MEENAQEATRKIATRIVRKTTREKTMKGRGKQHGKQHKKTRQQDKEEVDTKIYTFPIKIKISLAYLVAIVRAKRSLHLRLRSEIKRIIVHLGKGVRGKRKTTNSLSKRDEREYLFCGNYESLGVRISHKQDTFIG